MARPSKYHTHVEPRLNEIRAWARDGATEAEIAKRLRISENRFYAYKKEFSQFSQSLTPAHAYDDEVVDELHKNTLGRIVKLQKPIKVRKKYFENGKLVREEEVIENAVEEIYVPPDTKAQIYWLNNRRPSKWKNNPVEQPDPNKQAEEDKQKDELYERLINRRIEGFNDEQDDLQ